LKKLLYYLPITFLFLYSCQKAKIPTKAPDTSVDYKKGEAFAFKQNDSAFYYFNKVVSGSKDSLQIANALNYLAAMQSDAGDYFGAQETLTMSLKFLDEKDPNDRSCLASDYNELGLNGTHLKDYDAAIGYFDSAVKFSPAPEYTLQILNNQANAYQNKKDYTKALKLYQSVLAKRKKVDVQYARELSNMARTKWLANPSYKAASQMLKALHIREKEKDLWGENSSYTHLAEYYANTDPDSALFYAKKLYIVTRQINSPDDQLDALQKLIRLAPVQDIKGYFARYQELSDSLQTSRNAAKNQFALIRYEAEKNKSDNLILQKDNTEKRYQLIKQQVLLGAAIFALIGGSIAVVFLYRKRKQRLEREAERSIRESQLKTSKRVHDVVANGLYRIMTEIEHREHLDKERLLDQIESMYEQSRDISYEKQQPGPENFHEKIANLLTSFANLNTKVVIVSNSENTWADVGASILEQVRHIVLELMINMKKHSKASQVAVRFERKEKHLFINYSDNGVGLPKELAYGNGLSSADSRLKAIAGEMSVEDGPENGVRIRISFPVA
jgi:signal transduction histidine kinase